MSQGRYVELGDRCPWCTKEDTLDDYSIGEIYEWTADGYCGYGEREFPVGVSYIEHLGCHTCEKKWNDLYDGKPSQKIIGYVELSPAEYKVAKSWGVCDGS